MAENNNENLFRRLTKLFRSGPTVKRRVRSYDPNSRTASTAVDLFKKAHSDVYNSTLSAYGTFDRMIRGIRDMIRVLIIIKKIKL